MSIIFTKNLSKEFRRDGSVIPVLSDIHLSVVQGESIALTGPSGSGKSTLLSLLAGLDHPTQGEVVLDGEFLGGLSEDELADIRSEKVGFVFQSFQLLNSLTALENVMVPAELRGRSRVRERAKELLAYVGLENRLDHYPTELSGGEQQRVAIARAYINQPKILLADEPTGSLDFENAALVEKLLFSLQEEHRTSLVIATHNPALASKTDRIMQLSCGHLCEVPQ